MDLYPCCIGRFPWKSVWTSFLIGFLAISPKTSLQAQPADPGTPFPRLLRILPTGAQIGAETTLTLHGTDLEGPREILTNHPGIRAAIVPDEAQKKDPKAAPSPTPKIKVTVAKDVPAGEYAIRLVNQWGVSNLKILPVSDLPEGEEKEPNNDVAQATPFPWKSWMSGTLGGGTDVDYYAVDVASTGPVVVYCQASSIQSPAEPRVELINPAGRIIATSHHHKGTDALICYRATQPGKYMIRVSEFGYNRGGADYLYRIYAGPGPWVEATRPTAVQANRTASVEIIGFGLKAGEQGKGPDSESVTINAQPHQFQIQAYLDRPERRMANETLLTLNAGLPTGNPVNPIVLPQSNLPVLDEKEPNDTPETAQEIPTTVDVSGAINKQGDLDYYRFAAKKGERFRIDLLPTLRGRLNQATLKVISLGKDKNILANKEDDASLSYPKFFQRGLDVSLDFTAPADGNFAIRIGSRLSESVYGPSASYRLRIQPTKPLFLAYAVAPYIQNPGAVLLAKGGNAGILVYLQRLDGFTGEVQVIAEGLPPGIQADPLVISSQNSVGQLILRAADNAQEIQQPLRLTAISSDPPLRQEVYPLAMRTTLPNAAIILPIVGVDPELMIAVRGTAPFLLKATADKDGLKPGEKTEIKVQLTRKLPDKTVVAVQGLESPGNILNNNQPQNIEANKEEIKIPVTAPANATPGTYPLAVRGQSAIPYAKDPAAKQKPPANMVNWSNTVNIEILPTTLGTFQPTPMEGNWKIGKPAKLQVKVTRANGYQGEIKLTPADKGDGQIKVLPGSIPAGADTAILNVEIAPNATPGNKANLSLNADGQWKDKYPVTQKIPLNLNLVK